MQEKQAHECMLCVQVPERIRFCNKVIPKGVIRFSLWSKPFDSCCVPLPRTLKPGMLRALREVILEPGSGSPGTKLSHIIFREGTLGVPSSQKSHHLEFRGAINVLLERT